jgi:hypothetical protein
MLLATKPATLELIGASGKHYSFEVHPFGTRLEARPGVFLTTLATRNTRGGQDHGLLHVGFSENIDDCLKNRKQPAHLSRFLTPHTAPMVGVLYIEDEDTRLDTETDLISAYQPLCNYFQF